jgi:hypothetical protein
VGLLILAVEVAGGRYELPGGWMDEPRFKPSNFYLTNPVWVGGEFPAGCMGPPYGLGGECWFTTAYQASSRSSTGWARRRTFASVDRDALFGAAREWAVRGFSMERPARSW